MSLPVTKMYRQMILVSSSQYTSLKTNMMIPLKLSTKRLCSSLVNGTSSSSDKKFYDIVVAGGGMVGCAMACKLCNYFNILYLDNLKRYLLLVIIFSQRTRITWYFNPSVGRWST